MEFSNIQPYLWNETIRSRFTVNDGFPIKVLERSAKDCNFMVIFTQIAYYPILGKPLIFYLGILTITSLLFTASIVPLNRRQFWRIPFKYHPMMAKITITLALIHGILAILIYI